MIHKTTKPPVMRIFKYRVPNTRDFELLLPEVNHFLSLQLQRGIPCMWFMVDSDAPLKLRKYYIAETGERLPDIVTNFPIYLGTFQLDHDTLVYHLFDIT